MHHYYQEWITLAIIYIIPLLAPVRYDDEIIADSYKILEYLDETYPEPPLNPPNNKEAEEVTG